MAIVTLTTDMGTRDFYVAAVKATLLSKVPDCHIVDVSHHVEKFNINQAAYLLRNVYKGFPEGTVHIIGVKPILTKTITHVIVKEAGQYFIAADNGIFSFLFDRIPEQVIEITLNQDTDDLTFPTKDVFAKAAIHLLKGGTPEVIGRPAQIKNVYNRLQPLTDPGGIKGHVSYIDRYENVITNISRKAFNDIGRGRDFEIRFRRNRIKSIHTTYSAVHAGEAVAIWSSAGMLELAINQGTDHSGGGASRLFGLRVDDAIRIDFLL